MIEFVWFDLGYTILYKKREETYRRLINDFGIDLPLTEIEKAFHLMDKKFMREYPGVLATRMECFMPWYLGMVNHRLGVTADLCVLGSRWVENARKTETLWYPYEHVKPLLSELKDSGYRLGVISNWDKTARPILEQYGLLDYFDTCVISSEAGVSKPSAEIFRLAMKQAGVSAENSIYVGDNYYDDATGASAVGMCTIIVNRFGNLGIEELKDIPVIEDIRGIIPYLGRESA